MTSDKAFKRKVRGHARDRGIAYTAARRHLLRSEEKDNVSTAQSQVVSCSFCGKSQQQVKKLIAGPSVYICEECVALSVAVWAVEQEPRVGHWTDEALAQRLESFTPEFVAAGRRLMSIRADSVRRQLAEGKTWQDVARRLRMSEEEARAALAADKPVPDPDDPT